MGIYEKPRTAYAAEFVGGANVPSGRHRRDPCRTQGDQEAIAKGDPEAAEKAARLHCIRSCDDMLARYRLPHTGASTGEEDASP